MSETNVVLGNCYARLESGGRDLIVGSERIERRWRIDNAGRLYPRSLQDKETKVEWLRHDPANDAQPSPLPASLMPNEDRALSLTHAVGHNHPAEAESLVVTLTAAGQTATLLYRFQIFPRAAGIVMQMALRGPAVHKTDGSVVANPVVAPTGIESDIPVTAAPSTIAPLLDLQESLALAPQHLRLTQVEFRDRTDQYNELVHENEWLLLRPEAPLNLDGNLFLVEDTLTQAGLIFLKIAPLPHARPVKASTPDFRADAGSRRFVLAGHGVSVKVKPPEPGGEDDFGSPWVTLVYEGGGAGCTAALQTFQRQMRPYEPLRDGKLLSNTWGDRNRDSRINAAFLTEEIEAASRLGIEVVQIDDGWQKGTTSNSVHAATQKGVWEGFYRANPDFWQPNPTRFPEGFAPLMRTAREHGVQIGLWFAPDSSEDFAHWREDADRLLAVHREQGVNYIKIDGVKLRTPLGGRNLRAFFDRVIRESQGRVVFDSDVTAETRPGYFGLMDTGPLFVENRYTDLHRYWPHATLRNLWRLSRYIDPLRLRMEWLNNARNTKNYADDALGPVAYRPDYLFATVLFSSPLGWFEVSHLPDSYFAEAAPLIATWKKHRAALFSGTVLPIGDVPDGTAWTGFASVAPERHQAYVLLFREWNTVSERSLALPLLSVHSEAIPVTILAGKGTLRLQKDAQGKAILTAHIPERQRFLFARIG